MNNKTCSLPIDNLPKRSIKKLSAECAIIEGDSFRILKKLPDKSINLVFADPPYFLSDGGITCNSGKMVSVNKGKWDEAIEIDKKISFNRKWLKEVYRVLADDGTLWISGTFHIIYAIAVALEKEHFKIINNVTWQKTNPPPNIACKTFVHSTETVLWAKKADSKKYTFNYLDMKLENGGKQMKDVWSSSLTPHREKIFGKHPTQKPLFLLNRIIQSSSKEGDVVLDPFAGSFTTGVAALSQNRKFIGIEKEHEYVEIGLKRISNLL